METILLVCGLLGLYLILKENHKKEIKKLKESNDRLMTRLDFSKQVIKTLQNK